MIGPNSTLNIYGGIIKGDSQGLRVLSGEVNIHGGRIEGEIDLFQKGGAINLFVRSATMNGQPMSDGPLSATSGTVDVTYADWTTDSLQFNRLGGTINIAVVPEPSTLSVALGLLGLLGSSRCLRRTWINHSR